MAFNRSINFKAGLDTKGIATGVQQIEGHMSKLNGSIKSISRQFSNLGGMIAGAFAVQGISGAIQSTVTAASDLNETISKTQAIFGASSSEIRKFAETAAESLGLSKTAAMDGAATFATFGKAAGLSGSALVTFSTDLLKLSADLASFYNTSPEEAITAIGAALRGESEPIRRYGVLLDDATLRQVALKNGITDTIKNALTPQQKALAANLAIFEQTTDAQGDFARTSDGLANGTRILNAELANMKAILGQELLPLLTSFVSKIGPAIADLAKYGRAAFGTMSSGQIDKVEEEARKHAAIQNTVFLQQELNREQDKYNELVKSQGFVITDSEYRERILFKARMNAFREEYQRRVDLVNQTIAQVNAQNKLNTTTPNAGGGMVRSYNEQIAMASKNTMDFSYSLEGVPSKLDSINGAVGKLTASEGLQNFQRMVEELTSSIQHLVTSIAVDFFGTIGEALAGADNSFKSFAERALSTLGTFFKQIGGMFIAFGVAQMEFAKSLLNPANPANAAKLIAAGAALAVIGGAISQASKSFAETGQASGMSAGSPSTFGYGYDFQTRIDGYDLVVVGDRNKQLRMRRG